MPNLPWHMFATNLTIRTVNDTFIISNISVEKRFHIVLRSTIDPDYDAMLTMLTDLIHVPEFFKITEFVLGNTIFKTH